MERNELTIEKLRGRIDDAIREEAAAEQWRERARESLRAAVDAMEKEFGTASLPEGEALLNVLKEEQQQALAKLAEILDELEGTPGDS